jgi:hypothetical protein
MSYRSPTPAFTTNPKDLEKATPPEPSDSPKDAHEGATEDQVSETPAPAGPLYEDEPKQG